jgi:hypothetical protein
MASAETLLSLYMATAESNEEEAKANVDELSNRISLFARLLMLRNTIATVEVVGLCTKFRRILNE